MKIGVFGALVALTAFFAVIGGMSVAFSAEPGNQEMVLAVSETRIEPVHLSSGPDDLSSSDGELPASNKWPFEVLSILILGLIMQIVGWGLRKRQGDADEIMQFYLRHAGTPPDHSET